MHEYIELQFRRKAKAYRLDRQVGTGFQFVESDALVHSINLAVRPDNDITEYRMSRIRQVQGWQPGQFLLRISVEDGSLVIRGDDQYSLPEGQYRVTVNVSDLNVKSISGPAKVAQDSHGVVTIELEGDERDIAVDLTNADVNVLRILDASTLDGQGGRAWVEASEVRASRRACVLNLLAVLRVTPVVSNPLITGVRSLFRALDERAYASIDAGLFKTVAALAERDDRPFYAEGSPKDKMHFKLIEAATAYEPAAAGIFATKDLQSFRAEGTPLPQPSLQMVMPTPHVELDHTFADLDLDLGNPLQDIAGLVVHIGELLNGKPTNHLDLRAKLDEGKAKPYLYYRVTN